MCGVFGILLCERECTHLCADVHTRECQVPYSIVFCLISLSQGLTESGGRLAVIKAQQSFCLCTIGEEFTCEF